VDVHYRRNLGTNGAHFSTGNVMHATCRLTCRELEVLRLLARGCTYIQVGDGLGVSVHTVESHIKNIYRKLNAHSARAAVWRARELHLLVESHGLQLASQDMS
jgi:ATP/maltotriose-dependent transcriptional regulator MalT